MLTYGLGEFAEQASRRVLTLGLLLPILLYWYLRRKINRRNVQAFAAQHGCKPMRSKFPHKWPLGLDVLYRQYQASKTHKLLAFQTPFMEKLGSSFELGLFGDQGFLTYDPKNVEAVCLTNFEDYCLGSRSDALRAFLGEGIFTQDGHKWKHSREVLRRPFVKMHYQNLTVFTEHINDLMQNLERAPSGVVDLQPFFFSFTLATTTALIFGQPVKDYNSQVQHAFAESFDHASLVSAIRIRLADLYWAYTPKKYRESCKVVKRYAEGFVREAMANEHSRTDERYAFIQDLIDEYQDPILVRDQLVNVLIAGRDTTAATLGWVFFLLVRHRSVLDRLSAEIIEVIGSNPDTTLTRSHIQRMTYLRQVLHETLRLYPQLPVNVRIASRHTVIPRGGGPTGDDPVMIPAGKGIGWSTYHMHRSRDIYGDDASTFRPERWEEGKLDQVVKDWGWMGFHGGPRTCLGKDFAMMEASCAIVAILRKWGSKLRLPEGEEVVPTGEETQTLGVLVISKEGCRVVLQ